MSAAPQLEIERDLVRWPRAKWVATILAVLIAQGVLLLFAPRSTRVLRGRYPKEPRVGFAHFSEPGEWLELQDASLFANANPRGFSGAAWMIEPTKIYFQDDMLPRPMFLHYTQFRPERDALAAGIAPLPHTRPIPRPTEPAQFIVSAPPRNEQSRVHIDGFESRRLREMPVIPVQYATDVVRESVVQALVDSEGLVFSCRLLESSGSRGVDNSALELARKARFTPVNPPGEQKESVSSGTLTFDWFTLDAASTNSVSAKASPAK